HGVVVPRRLRCGLPPPPGDDPPGRRPLKEPHLLATNVSHGMKDRTPGTLTVAAVPIGCPDDASPRLAAALSRAQVIAAEDTRRLARLAARLGVAPTAPIVSSSDAGEQRQAARLGA